MPKQDGLLVTDGDIKANLGPKPPERDENGSLTLEGMRQAIRSGNSVHVVTPNGLVAATSEDQLPSEAEFAAANGGEKELQAALETIERHRQKLDADTQLIQRRLSGEVVAPRSGAKQNQQQQRRTQQQNAPATPTPNISVNIPAARTDGGAKTEITNPPDDGGSKTITI